MGKATTPARFKEDFCKRLESARIMAGFNQTEAAKALGVLTNTYNKYETRSLLPHHLVPRVCELFDIDEKFLFTGAEQKRKMG